VTLDRMLYLVISDHRDGPIIYEVEVSRMSMATVCKDIRDGQYDKVLHVIEFNPVERICRDATHEFRSVID
jgi:hypothetical protein